jgi:thioredoxin-related protein
MVDFESPYFFRNDSLFLASEHAGEFIPAEFNMAVNWSKDVDQALVEAKEKNRPILLDFSAAPAWGACARLDAESYEDLKTAEFIQQNFIPVKAHIKEHPAWFHRFDAVWTPTVLLLDADGRERARLEGYLPNIEFLAALENGLGRIALVHKKYADAERLYNDVVTRFPKSHPAPEAMYWRAVAHYKATNDHTVLGKVADELRNTYPASIWASKAIPWMPKEAQREVA